MLIYDCFQKSLQVIKGFSLSLFLVLLLCFLFCFVFVVKKSRCKLRGSLELSPLLCENEIGLNLQNELLVLHRGSLENFRQVPPSLRNKRKRIF